MDVRTLRRKIENAFHQESIETLYTKMTNGDCEKQTRFKRILIDCICKNPSIDPSLRQRRNDLKQLIKDSWGLQDHVGSHDDVIKPEELLEFEDDPDPAQVSQEVDMPQGTDGQQIGPSKTDKPQFTLENDKSQDQSKTDKPQGSHAVKPQGTSEIDKPQGISEIDKTQGTSEIDKQQCAKEIDKQRVTLETDKPRGPSEIDNQQVTPEITLETDKPQGQSKTDKPQGPSQAVKPQSTPEIDKPQSTSEIDKQQDTPEIDKPQGTSDIGKHQGTLEIGKHQGTSEIDKQQHTLEIDKQDTPEIDKPKGPSEIDKPEVPLENDKPQGALEIDKHQSTSEVDKPHDKSEIDKTKDTSVNGKLQDISQSGDENERNSCVRDDDNDYTIRSHGLALILWNTEFLDDKGEFDIPHSRDKIGDEDYNMMKFILPKFNIKVIDHDIFIKNSDEGKAYGENLMKKEVQDKIKEVQGLIEKERPDVFICIVSTHGMENVEVRNDKQPLDNHSAHVVRHQLCFKDGLIGQPMFTDELIQAFDDDGCPELKGKPRLFFIQACSTRMDKGNAVLDEGAEIGVRESNPKAKTEEVKQDETKLIDKMEARGRKPKKEDEVQDQTPPPPQLAAVQPAAVPPLQPYEAVQPREPYEVVQPREPYEAVQPREPYKVIQPLEPYEVTPGCCFEDCLVMFASPPGKTAFGRENDGGWLISALFDEFKYWKEHPELDLLDVLTKVNSNVCEKQTNLIGKEIKYKTVSCIHHKLTKDVRLVGKE